MNQKEIEMRKISSDIMRDSARGAKQEKCFICGKSQTSFCNSHLIPRAVLENVAIDGKVLNSNAILGISYNDIDTGVAKTWTFQFICRECDSKVFYHYEKTDALLNKPTDIMLAEIALKNSLMMLYKQYHDQSTCEIFDRLGMIAGDIGVKNEELALNVEDYKTSARKAKRIIEQNKENEYNVIFYSVLDWKASIAVQASITLYRDINGDVLNDIYDLSYNVRMQDVHLCVFPYKQKTAILLFYHKNEYLIEKFEKQFKKLSYDKQLEYINYMIFRYTEHFAISPNLLKATKNKKLKKLFEQTGDYGNLGMVSVHQLNKKIKNIEPNEIPNFLTMKIE